MQNFDSYVKNKLKDDSFKKSYKENCNICPTVWTIVKTALDSGKTWKEISEETGLSQKDLTRFYEADNCQYEIILKLCEYFQIPYPESCSRFSFKNV